ncbi:DUF726-domain-containing protein [Gymnopus androsaceus JB14]|uniref:DUF726-domain-containing protein n=1 Tax=Gymnopus androsaceus JB14 TaxID=1447944 RepID=A0A6A4GMZ2_9AGAR|nr:DUF726-domain-containing protein [Gymnopus androsaceus JB14]
MPVIHKDELRGGIDEEDQRQYHYRPNPTHSTASSSTYTVQSTGYATGTTLDTDEAGYRWRSNPTMAAAHSSALSPDGSLHSFTTESNYTCLQHVEEDWEESDSLRKSTTVLFDDDYGNKIDDHKALTPLSQMQQTKSHLLSESQRIAIRDAPKSKSKGPSKPPPICKEFSPELYYHIGRDEHGVEPSELIPSLCEMKSVPRGGRGAWEALTTTGDDSKPDNLTLDMCYTLLCDLFLLLIADSVYDSRSRHLLFRVARYLGLSPINAVSFESRIKEAVGISEETEGGGGLQTNKVAVQAQITTTRKRLLGLATLGGGLVIGLSAGLLAPVIGVGLGMAFGTIGISSASTFLAGSAVGFLNSPLDDPRLPFSVLNPIVSDVFSVLWEPEMIRETGEVLSQIGQTVLQTPVMATLMTALQWPIILTNLGYLIDNPWSNTLDRARATPSLLVAALYSNVNACWVLERRRMRMPLLVSLTQSQSRSS